MATPEERKQLLDSIKYTPEQLQWLKFHEYMHKNYITVNEYTREYVDRLVDDLIVNHDIIQNDSGPRARKKK